MMLRYSILLATGLLLGGCCLSGNCYAPVAGSAPAVAPTGVATTSSPDGLDSALMDEPEADVPAKPRKTAQRRRETIGDSEASAASRYYRGDSYEQQEAADRADEARLKRKLIICQSCAPSGN